MPRRLVQLGCAALLSATALSAQDRQPNSVLIQPTATSYAFGEGDAKTTVEQVAIPVVLMFPFHQRFSVDVTSAAAYSRVVAGDSTISEIYGPTDTQVRANIQILLNRLVLTLGVNAPSGQYRVDTEQTQAAGQIGNDFLFYPISSMGNGFAGTGGLAFAAQVANWNLGFGGSVRKAAEFSAFDDAQPVSRFQPGDEYRFRVTAERAIWLGTASLGLTYSAFGEDRVEETTTYSTGDRLIATAGWNFPVKRVNVFVSGWNLYRYKGEQFGGPAPRENIFNFATALSVPVKKWTVQPNVETRLWQVGGDRAGRLFNYGMRLSIPIGERSSLQPSFGMTSGTLYSLDDGSSVKMNGWQGSLLIWRR